MTEDNVEDKRNSKIKLSTLNIKLIYINDIGLIENVIVEIHTALLLATALLAALLWIVPL